MALPFSFSNNVNPTGPQLDADLAALGALTPIPCTMTGASNTLLLVPFGNAPAVNSYTNMQPFTAISTAFNTGPVTVAVGTLAALPVFIDTELGPAVLQGGEIVTRNAILLIYDAALASNTGGFHLVNPTQEMLLSETTVVNSTVGTTLTAIALTGFRQGIIDRTGVNSGGFNDTTDTAANIISAMPGALPTFTTFRFRYFNDGTTQTATIVGGTSVTMAGPVTIANNVSHDFIGVVTSPTTVKIFG